MAVDTGRRTHGAIAGRSYERIVRWTPQPAQETRRSYLRLLQVSGAGPFGSAYSRWNPRCSGRFLFRLPRTAMREARAPERCRVQWSRERRSTASLLSYGASFLEYERARGLLHTFDRSDVVRHASLRLC